MTLLADRQPILAADQVVRRGPPVKPFGRFDAGLIPPWAIVADPNGNGQDGFMAGTITVQ